MRKVFGIYIVKERQKRRARKKKNKKKRKFIRKMTLTE